MKNKFTVNNAAMLLIDHQQGTIKLAVNLPYKKLVHNTRALARTAVETGMPLVLTSSQEDRFQGPLLQDIQDIAPEAYADRVKRPGIVDAWDYPDFRTAVEATGKKKIIMAGLTNDVCIVFPSISMVEEGYEVQVVVDGGGSPTQTADETAIQRMKDAGVTITSTNQVMAELASDWADETGAKIQGIMYEEILAPLVEAEPETVS